MTYLGNVPEGVAAAEAERILGHPVQAARARYTAMAACSHKIDGEGEPCSRCGAEGWEIACQDAHQRALDEARAAELRDEE